MQDTFKAKSFYEATAWTSYSCDIEITSKTRWSEPELGRLLRCPCRDSSGFLNLHGNSTVFSARWLGGLWSIDLLNFAWFTVFEQKLAQIGQTQFCCSLIPINLILIAFIWLQLANDHFKNIWSEIEMMKWHCYTWYQGLKVKLRLRGSNFKTSWLACEVKSAFGWWVRFWRAGIEHGSLYLCKTNTDWYLLLKVNS